MAVCAKMNDQLVLPTREALSELVSLQNGSDSRDTTLVAAPNGAEYGISTLIPVQGSRLAARSGSRLRNAWCERTHVTKLALRDALSRELLADLDRNDECSTLLRSEAR